MRLKVTNCRKEKENYNITVEYLDENPIKFYTDGKGGQLGDRGTIGEAKVLEVLAEEIVIDRELNQEEYDYTIDFNRREDSCTTHCRTSFIRDCQKIF